MRKLALVSVLLVIPALVHGQDDLAQTLALQKVMQKVIREAEPSIACILVSRSDGYKRVGQPPPAPEQGKLGGFQPIYTNQRNEQDALYKRLDLADPAHVPESFGSGVVVERKGLILTHYHVVKGATKVFIRLPGGQASYADIHAADPRSDLAVLRMLNENLNLKEIKRGDGGKLERGQFVLSIANPFAAGFRDGQPSASWGIVSNLRRRAPSGNLKEDDRSKTLHQFGTLIQTDARLTMGCSGGALLNLQGEMVGLISSMAGIHGGETPGGFAVPIDDGMERIINVLIRGEEVDYGFLGVTINPPSAAGGAGASLNQVTRGSPAETEAGLHPGDVITKVGDMVVRDGEDLLLALGMHLAGERVRLEIRRYGNQPTTVHATLVKHNLPHKPIASSLGPRPRVRGLRVDYTSLLPLPMMNWGRGGRGWGGIPRGVLVTEVDSDGPAANAKLKIDDVITHVNGSPVNTPAAFYREFTARPGPIEVTVGNSNLNQPPIRITIN